MMPLDPLMPFFLDLMHCHFVSMVISEGRLLVAVTLLHCDDMFFLAEQFVVLKDGRCLFSQRPVMSRQRRFQSRYFRLDKVEFVLPRSYFVSPQGVFGTPVEVLLMRRFL
ncbi:hypothetical protein PLANPX_1898 [Lacipirellula parvula]|uniref:Uncharacterized protein n=1 Tax=Lacipirellula parvula TaxID=2650471 RepID=A0A5K7XD23_9BACT|nr:hypothetical protein PLANPX_1898 [Lacipirellula parvula]